MTFFEATKKTIIASNNFFTLNGKVILLLALIIMICLPTGFGDVIRTSLSEAYIAVTSFVALTLLFIYFIEKIFSFDIGEFNATHPNLQIGVSALLGALPGCGGAIIVLTQFAQRKVSFGAIIAALTATMGDAAFVLIAAKPLVGLSIMGFSLFAGIITGWIVNKIHGPDFLRVDRSKAKMPSKKSYENTHWTNITLKKAWWIIIIPGIALGIANAFQVDFSTYPYGETLVIILHTIGIFGCLITLFLWVFNPDYSNSICVNNHNNSQFERVISDTCFITAWVVFAFLSYEITVYAFAIDLKVLFSGIYWLIPLVGILVGFIPGCGPQIIVTTLYINGIIPLSAQIGNAISNDGDALFPAIAVAPKAAIIATLYSAIPALIFAYSYFFLFEI